MQSDDFQHNGEQPDELRSLVDLYYDKYKPLYSRLQAFNQMPIELVFETAAAWDHLSRHWRFDEPEAKCVDKASRHLKRAVFDAYKLLLKKAVDDYDDLVRINTSLIDNGQFDVKLRLLMSEIRVESIAARDSEGDTRGSDGWGKAFDLWAGVFQKIERFNSEFYLNPNVEWAKTKMSEMDSKRWWMAFWCGFASSIAATVVLGILGWLIRYYS
jgi:hypothetical protein